MPLLKHFLSYEWLHPHTEKHRKEVGLTCDVNVGTLLGGGWFKTQGMEKVTRLSL